MSPHVIATSHTLLFLYTQASLNWGKKDEPVYVTEESGVVGLNFHQSKEVLIHDSTNGIANHYDVRNFQVHSGLSPLKSAMYICASSFVFAPSMQILMLLQFIKVSTTLIDLYISTI